MTIEEYIDLVFDFDEDLSEEDIAQKLTELGVSEEDQEALGKEFLAILAPDPNKKTNEPT